MDISKTEFVNAGRAFEATGLVHRVLKPDVPGPHRGVVMIHGHSGDEDVMWVFASTLPKNWLIVAPRGSQIDPDGGYTWHAPAEPGWPPLSAFDAAAQTIARLIRALPRVYNADPDHIYLMGFSQGAALAFAAAMRHPGLVRGIAGLVGFVPIADEEVTNAEPLKGLTVLMIAGRGDELIPLEIAEGGAQVLHAAGARLDYRVYDTGHRLNADGMRDLKAWWRKQSTK